MANTHLGIIYHNNQYDGVRTIKNLVSQITAYIIPYDSVLSLGTYALKSNSFNADISTFSRGSAYAMLELTFS